MKTFLKLSLAIFLFSSILSCKKENPTYPFTIQVINEEGVPLPNIFVEATADVPNSIPDFSGITNDDGLVSFTYEYEAVLKIRATRSSNPPTWMGCNFVKLEADNNVRVVVVVTKYDPSQPGC